MGDEHVSIIEAIETEIREMDDVLDEVKHKAQRVTKKTAIRLQKFFRDHTPHDEKKHKEPVSHHYWDLIKSKGIHN